MSIKTQFPFSVTEHADWQITLGDGCVLSARVWMPAGDGPFPAILEYLPYRKRDGTTVRDTLTHPYFAGHGYACFRVDMRGNGESDGLMEDEYTAQELADAVEVIQYLAAQPWSNGKVGMMGISWGGFNGLQVAALNPAPLKAVITLCSTVDRYADDIHYKGGCLLNENLGWGATMWSYSSRAPDPALRDNWREQWLARLEAEPFLPELWLQHQQRDDYWKHGSVCDDYSAITAAVLAVGGWGDSYKNAVGALIENLSSPVKGIIGPWVHKYPHFAVPEPRIGFLQEALRWWDRWLKDLPTGVEQDPNLRLFVQQSEPPKPWYTERQGRFIGLESYPAPNQTLQFAALPQVLNSPQTTGADSGEYCAIWLGPELPGDQQHDDALSLCHTEPPLAEPLQIIGRPVAEFAIEAPKGIGKIAIRLCEVDENGASTRLSYAVCNLAQYPSNNGLIHAKIELDAMAHRAAVGQRLRISISDSYWPLIWPAPEVAELTLHKLCLHLPTTSADSPVTFPPPESATPLALKTLRDEDHIRRTDTDADTGRQTLTIIDDFGKTQDLSHGLITGTIAREIWSIHPDDPNSATGECHWTSELERDDIALRTEARCSMRSDTTHFHLNAQLEAYENDVLFFEKSADYSIPRQTQ